MILTWNSRGRMDCRGSRGSRCIRNATRNQEKSKEKESFFWVVKYKCKENARSCLPVRASRILGLFANSIKMCVFVVFVNSVGRRCSAGCKFKLKMEG